MNVNFHAGKKSRMNVKCVYVKRLISNFITFISNILQINLIKCTMQHVGICLVINEKLFDAAATIVGCEPAC